MTDTTITPPAVTPDHAPESWGDTQKILALTYSFAFIIVIVLLIFTSPKADPQIFTLLTALVGVLATQVSNIVSYYFGSTKSSQTKDTTIQAQAMAAIPPVAPPAAKVTP
jgi:hypothetical protein